MALPKPLMAQGMSNVTADVPKLVSQLNTAVSTPPKVTHRRELKRSDRRPCTRSPNPKPQNIQALTKPMVVRLMCRSSMICGMTKPKLKRPR